MPNHKLPPNGCGLFSSPGTPPTDNLFMTLTVDQQDISTAAFQLSTVDDALRHASASGRLVVSLLIDGDEPEDPSLPSIRSLPLAGRCVYIETADTREMAAEALSVIASQIDEAEACRQLVVQQLQNGTIEAAMPSLGRCFTTWLTAQNSLRAVCELAQIDLTTDNPSAAPLVSMLADFTAQLRQLKQALEVRDYVLVSDVVAYEMEHSASRWHEAIDSLRAAA